MGKMTVISKDGGHLGPLIGLTACLQIPVVSAEEVRAHQPFSPYRLSSVPGFPMTPTFSARVMDWRLSWLTFQSLAAGSPSAPMEPSTFRG